MSRIEFTAIPTLPYTSNGVTWTSPSSHHFRASGTATANSRLFLNQTTLPAWIQYDHVFNVHLEKSGTTNNVTFIIQLERNDGTWYTAYYNYVASGSFTIPSSSIGYRRALIELRLSTGYTANEEIYPYLIAEPAFQPRFSSTGIRYSPYWYSRNPFYNAGYGMPNCTCYAWGRFWEIADPNRTYTQNRPTLSTGNGADFYPYTQDGYTRGQKPQLGAIACYSGGNPQYTSGLGHVCVLEQENSDGTWTVSESAYDHSYWFRATHKILANGDYNNALLQYNFQGFIYNPYAGDTDTPPYIEGGNFHLILAKRALLRGKGELIL